jgi:release factor glutamine methyltransferase
MIITVGEVLEGASHKLRQHSDSASADAQLLLGEVLGQPRAWILAHSEYELSSVELAEFDGSLTEVLDGVALPYVLGWWEFYGRRFHIDPQVLIPRPETELMVEEALHRSGSASRILDLGTGSGCIAVTLALELPHSHAYASDLSWEALQVARRNVEAHGVEQMVTLVNSNLSEAFAGPLDLICANLPYIASDHLPKLEVAGREPKMALDGGKFGTELIVQTLERLPGILGQGGCALFEIDPDQAARVIDQARSSFPSAELRIEKDLAGRDRLLVLEHG